MHLEDWRYQIIDTKALNKCSYEHHYNYHESLYYYTIFP